jgi:DNA-binding NtrC family response regulator
MPGNARMQGHAGQKTLVSKGRALVVNEDRADLAYYQVTLQRAGWGVVASSSYEEALEFFQSGPFDLVVVSQGSRAFEGRQVLERALMADRNKPVLVVTRSLDMECYLEAMQLGAADYLEEPVPETDLTRMAEGFVASRPAAA